ncbi:hypothetical protein BC937DRAFT_88752 [Endogone sp. FLAS-F59071]|nr:hypothetical protein BC937DRAFT_88752 [Endogone sp. FLAS-F59071]|eukprot:RUS22492.1 hypothetical protein BC937DRAFT_88752 [Endogone sp. FLAS-F59071]
MTIKTKEITADAKADASSKHDASQHSKSNLFVRNIPYDATSAELEAFFSELGPVRSCFVVLDNAPQLPEPVLAGETAEAKKRREAPKNKGYGFVQYALPEDADRAVKDLAEVKFRGERKLKIEHALKRGVQHEAGEKGVEKAEVIKKKQEARMKREEKAKAAVVKKEKLSEKSYGDAVATLAPRKTKGHLSEDELLPYRTVVLEGLGKDLTKKHIYKKARKSGEATEIVYPVFSEAKEGEEKTVLEGVAHIIYKLPRDAQTAVKNLDGHVFKGAPLKAKALETGPAPAPRVDNYIDKNARLIVRNLPWKAILILNGTVHHERTIAVDWALAKDKYIEAEAKAEENDETDPMEVDGNEDGTVKTTENGEKNGERDNGDDAESSEGEDDEDDEDDESNDKERALEDDDEESVSNEDDGSDVVMEDEVDDDDEMDEGMDVGESDSEGDGDDEISGKPTKKPLPTPTEGTTLFVRNLPFEATEEEIKELFETWGAVRYARITMDKDTGRSRGTGFVCFKDKFHADACLEEAEKVQSMSRVEDTDVISHQLLSNKQKKQKGVLATGKSVLTPDPGSGMTSAFMLHARVLDVVRAVERGEAGKLAETNMRKREREDKRNVYLMREGGECPSRNFVTFTLIASFYSLMYLTIYRFHLIGIILLFTTTLVIFPDTPAAATLTPAELQKRQMSYAARKKLLASNPSLFISKTRLSIRNLPVKITDADLKKLGVEAVAKFKASVKAAQRTDLTPEEKAEGWSFKPHVKQAKIVRAKDRVDAATQQLRSKGYGFLEFRTHAHALAALRYLNNNPEVFDDTKRLTVEFSVENKEVESARTQ